MMEAVELWECEHGCGFKSIEFQVVAEHELGCTHEEAAGSVAQPWTIELVRQLRLYSRSIAVATAGDLY